MRKRVPGVGWVVATMVSGLSLCFVPVASGEPGGAAPEGKGPAAPDWRLPAAQRAEVEALGRTLIEAIRASDDAARRKRIEACWSAVVLGQVGIDRITGQMARVDSLFPGLEFHRAELAETVRGGEVSRILHVYARKPGESLWRDLQIRVSKTAPHRLESLAFIAEVTEPVYLPNGAITDPSTLEWLNHYVDRLVAENDLSGSVLLAVGDRVLFERGFGFEDAARTRPVHSKTLFNLASASKMFTALGVARLVADGKLSFSDTIDRFFPDFPDTGFARRATVGHLLSHTSGVREYWTEETTEELRKVRSTAEVLPLVYRAGVGFEPGARHEYSNSNFILAGLIIERVSGKTYEEFIAELITGPLGLADTGPFETGETKRPPAEALGRGREGWVALPRGIRGTAAGGWFSTPGDMQAFLSGLVAGRVVSREMLAILTTTKTGDPEDASGYGYGFILERSAGVSSFGHGGIAPGANSEVRHFPAPGISFVIFSNQDNGAYDDLRRNIEKLITGER